MLAIDFGRVISLDIFNYSLNKKGLREFISFVIKLSNIDAQEFVDCVLFCQDIFFLSIL